MDSLNVMSLLARPAPIALDPAKTAVIVIDMENDFGSEGGMFHRAGIDLSAIRKAVAPTARVLYAARQAGIRIVYLKMAYLPDLSDLGPSGAPNRLLHIERLGVGQTVSIPGGGEGRILVRGNWGTEIVDELKPEIGDVIVVKTRYSGFYQTDLDAILRAGGIDHLVVTGCTTSVCVESTIRDAFFRDYHVVLLADCTAEPIGSGESRGNHEATIHLVEMMFGRVSTSDEFVAAVGALETAVPG
jgi:ureidoacrylate peracid hydrolase